MEKLCKLCGETKPHSLFQKDKRLKLGIGAWCKECHNLKAKAWVYGTTLEEMRELKKTPTCEICDKSFSDTESVIDHCHETGEIRGVLCHECNMTLGFIEKEQYNKCIEYLNRNGNTQYKWIRD